METPIEGKTILWTAITIDRIKEFETDGEYQTALEELSLRRQGLKETLRDSSSQEVSELFQEKLGEQMQVLATEIKELDHLEVILKLKVQRRAIGAQLAAAPEGKEMNLLHDAEELNQKIAVLEAQSTQND